MIRAQMTSPESVVLQAEGEAQGFSSASALSPAEREMRAEIAQIASVGGRFASRLTRLMLELMMGQGRGGSPLD